MNRRAGRRGCCYSRVASHVLSLARGLPGVRGGPLLHPRVVRLSLRHAECGPKIYQRRFSFFFWDRLKGYISVLHDSALRRDRAVHKSTLSEESRCTTCKVKVTTSHTVIYCGGTGAGGYWQASTFLNLTIGGRMRVSLVFDGCLRAGTGAATASPAGGAPRYCCPGQVARWPFRSSSSGCRPICRQFHGGALIKTRRHSKMLAEKATATSEDAARLAKV